MGYRCIVVGMSTWNDSQVNVSESNMFQNLSVDVQSLWNWEYILLLVYLTLCCVIGTSGNIPVLIVYFHKRDQTVSNTFIKVLAILDMMVCIFIMPYTMVYELHMVESDFICRFFEFLRHFVICASNVTIVAISAERYIAVCKLSKKMSVQLVNKGMICIAIISCGMAAPAIGTFAVVSYKEVETLDCSFNHIQVSDGYFCHFTFSIMGEQLVFIYQGLLALSFIITLSTIVVLYSVIYYVLWKRSQRRKQRRARSRIASDAGEFSVSRDKITNEKANYMELDTSKNLLPQTEANSVSEKPSECVSESDCSGGKDKSVPDDSSSGKTKYKIKIKHTTSVVLEREHLRRAAHRRTAKMLFLCSVIYLVTWLPFWFDIFGLTANLLLRYAFFIGNATNPIVYGIVNAQVRKSFRKLLTSCAQKLFPCLFRE